MDHDNARLSEWLEAERRIARLIPARRDLLDDLTDLLVAELRRNVGRPFVLKELVAFYGRGTDWAVALVTLNAPGEPWAWDPRFAVEAAFSRYARFARDVGGGRRIGNKRFSEDDFGSKIIGS